MGILMFTHLVLNSTKINYRYCTTYVVVCACPSNRDVLFNPLNAELIPICHLLALLGAHHIFHVSGLRVKLGTF
jgi:hypothetical protein